MVKGSTFAWKFNLAASPALLQLNISFKLKYQMCNVVIDLWLNMPAVQSESSTKLGLSLEVLKRNWPDVSNPDLSSTSNWGLILTVLERFRIDLAGTFLTQRTEKARVLTCSMLGRVDKVFWKVNYFNCIDGTFYDIQVLRFAALQDSLSLLFFEKL